MDSKKVFMFYCNDKLAANFNRPVVRRGRNILRENLLCQITVIARSECWMLNKLKTAVLNDGSVGNYINIRMLSFNN